VLKLTLIQFVSCMLKCFRALGSVKEGEWAHRFLLRLGFGSYIAVINFLIAFYLKIWRADVARKLFAELIERDVVSWNSMICVYVANGLSDKGVEHFKEMLYLELRWIWLQRSVFFELCSNCSDVSLGSYVGFLEKYIRNRSGKFKICWEFYCLKFISRLLESYIYIYIYNNNNYYYYYYFKIDFL